MLTHPNLEITLEPQTNTSINFLDLNIKKEANKHTCKIIPSEIAAAYHSMIHRLVNTPMNNENYIKQT